MLKPGQNLYKERAGNSSPATNRKNKKSEPMDVNLGKNAFETPNLSAVTYSKKWESDISVEARKHLSDGLRQVEKVEALLSKQAPRTLERMLLSSAKPELVATLSPNWEKSYGSGPTQMRFSPYGNSQLTYEKSFQSQNEKKMFKDKHDDLFMTDDSSSSGYAEILEIPLEKTSTDITKLIEENSRSERLRWGSPSSSTVNFCKLQIMNKEEDLSPVSLEAFLKNNVSGRTSTITESAEPPMRPILLDFDEHSEINRTTNMKDKEIISAHIKKVYQTCQLDWDHNLEKGWPPEFCCDQKTPL